MVRAYSNVSYEAAITVAGMLSFHLPDVDREIFYSLGRGGSNYTKIDTSTIQIAGIAQRVSKKEARAADRAH